MLPICRAAGSVTPIQCPPAPLLLCQPFALPTMPSVANAVSCPLAAESDHAV